ncbi:MAG: ammonia-forming cytochrome c nitrite reductase subunit c552, partial [Bacteroidetes bacterium]|nr:ammonia-forming cytochrome c nitrite reductase subunit c552 [Bacteroidota bacterium]
MKPIREVIKEKPGFAWLIFLATIVVVFLLGMLASSIIERKAESIYTLQMIRPIEDWEPRNEIWGQNFPREYESYLKTLDTDFYSKHGGSGMIDYLEKYPELVVLWAGYGFSKDYKQGRGHGNA